MQDYSNTDLAWAAGFIDGEGCFHIQRQMRGTRPVFLPSLSAAQVGRAPLLKLQEMFGGGIYVQHRAGKHPNGKWANCHQWRIGSLTALKAAALLQPYLVQKQAAADIFIEFQPGLCAPNVGRGGLPQSEVDRRDALIARLTYLNRTGPR